MRGGRNNLLAGLLVLASVTAAVVVVVLLGGGLERLGKRDYRVRFDVEEGVTGLEAGSRVLVGGRPVGVVKALEFEQVADGAVAAIVVTISIDRRISLRRGTVAMLVSPLLGGSGTVNFFAMGEGAPLTAADIIDGQIAPPTMLAQAGYGPEQAEQVRAIIRNVKEASEKANTFLDDARSVTAEVRGKWPEWSGRVDSITKNIDETTAKGPAIAEDLQKRLDEVRELLATGQGYLDENRETVKETIASYRDIGAEGERFMARLNGELSDKTAGFLDSGREALAKAETALDTVQGILDEQMPTIRRSMANFRLASDQLAATLGEVRRSPWRLLYRPDKRELDFELLYDSARTYAAAVSDLRSATETLQSLSAARVIDPAVATGFTEELDRSFERYKEAEGEFLRRVMLHADESAR